MSEGTRPKRARWIIYAVLAALLLGAMGISLIVRSGRVEVYAAGRLTSALSTALGQPVSVERVTIRYFPPGAVLEGLRAEDPLLTARRAEATVSLRALVRGRFEILDLEIDSPVLHWDVDRGRLLAERPPAAPGSRPTGAASRVDLRRLRIQNGEVVIGSERRSVSADIEGLSVQGDNTAAGSRPGYRGPWEGSARFERARLVLGDLALDGLTGSLSFKADPERIEGRRLVLKADGIEIRGGGDLVPGSPVTGRIDFIAEVDGNAPGLVRPVPQIGAGHAALDMRVDLTEDGAVVSGTFVAEAPFIDPDRDADSDGPARAWLARRAEGEFTVRGGRAEARGTLLEFSGGTLRAVYVGEAGDGADGDRRHEITAEATRLNLARVLGQLDLPGAREAAPDAIVSGSAKMEWRTGEMDRAVGSAELTFEPEQGPFPLSGTATVGWTGRRATITSSSLAVPGSRLLLTGILDLSGPGAAFDLSGDLRSSETQPLAIFVERRFPDTFRPDADAAGLRPLLRPTDLACRLDARIRIEGTSTAPRVRAEFYSEDLALSVPLPGERIDLALRAAEGTVVYDPETLTLAIDRAVGDDLRLAGSATLDPSGGRLISLRLRDATVDAGLLARLAGLRNESVAVTGSAHIEMDLTSEDGSRGLTGPIALDADSIEVAEIALTEVVVRALFHDGSLDLQEGTLRLLGGTVRGSGGLASSGEAFSGRIDLEASALDLERLDPAIGEPGITGLLDLSGSVTFDDGVTLDGVVSTPALSVAGLELGAIGGTISGTPERIEFDLKDERGVLSAAGSLTTRPDPAIDAQVMVKQFSLEAVRPLMPAGTLTGLKGDADGVVTILGPLGSLEALKIQAVLDRLHLLAGDYPISSRDPVRITIEDGFLTLANTRLIGDRTDLRIGGSMVMGGSYEVTARLDGSYDLGLIEILSPEFRAAGPGTADLRIIERADVLTYTGTLTIDGGRLSHPSLPQPIENLSGLGRFEEGGRFEIDSIRFTTGGGQVTGTGWARFEGASIPEVHLALDGSGIRAELFPDLRAFFDAHVTMDKTGDEYQLTGDVSILRAIYSRAFGVEGSTLKLRSREFTPTTGLRGDAPTLLLDLKIVAGSDLWIRNEDALVEASADLVLSGTLDQPELAGRISAIEGGTYKFRDVTYRITGGSLVFADVTRIDPLIDIQAVTRIQLYEITLHITGRFSRPNYELTADPPLPQRDIVWLLLTGHTLADSSPIAARGFAEAQVAAYLAAPVAGVVSAPLEKVLGVTSVQIDPFFLNGAADPTARVTVTKRVTDKLLITYSSSLGQSGQDVYQMEFNPARRWDLIGTRDFDGSVGADIRFRRRWRGLEPAAESAPGAAARAAGDGIQPDEPKVGTIRLAADRLVDPEAKLIRRLVFDEGDPLRRADLLEGREKLRQHYVEHGFPAAQVTLIEEEPDPARPGAIDITYAIQAGPRHVLRISGDAPRRPIRKAVRTAWQEPILLDDLVEEARKAALDLLKGRGFYSAVVLTAREAEESDRHIVRLEVTPGAKVRVRSIRITGNESIDEERIRKQLLTQENGWFDFGSALLKEKILGEDIAAIRALYLASGHLGVRIDEPRIDLSDDGRQADVTISIHEGPVWRVGAVVIEGETPGVGPESLIEAARLERDSPVSPAALEAAADRVRERLDGKGYPDARVAYRLEGSSTATRVIFPVTTNERLQIREVIVKGNTRTEDRILRREVTLEEGAHLSRAEMLATQSNLYRLGVFQSVEVDRVPVEGRPGLVDLHVKVKEGSPILTAWGVGFDSEDKARASFELAHNNLFGTRRSAALFLRGSAVDRRVQISLRDPNLFGERIESLWSVFREEQEFESFDLRRLGASAQLTRKIGDSLTLFGRYRLEDIDLKNLQIDPSEAGQQTVRLASLGFSAARDTRDDIIYPSRGGLSSIDLASYKVSFGSEAEFTKIFLSATRYQKLGSTVVWASAVRAGFLTSGGIRDIPLSERFFAGGDTTLRGFRRDRAGPEDSGEPTGGAGLFLINQEIRFPLIKPINGVVFYDAGNVYFDLDDYDAADLRHVLGVGLRFNTPVGPFRIEYGRKLDRKRGESVGEIFFSIGQAF